jgi:hypothetical protein
MTAGHYALRGSGPGQKHALVSSALARVGCPGLWADWLKCVIRSLPFPTSLREASFPCAFVLLPYAVVGSGVR